MANGINIPITATIEGYQASLEKFKRDLGKIDPGSAIGKSISAALDQAEDKVKKFSANPVRTIGSDKQLGSLVSEAESVEEAIRRVQSLFAQVQAPDLNLNALGGEVQQILAQLEALNGDYTSRLNAGVQDAISSSEELKQKFADIGVDIERMGAAGGMQEVTRQLGVLSKEAEDAEKAIEKATTNLGEKQRTRDAFYAQHFDAAKLGAFDTETFDKLISEQYTNFDFSGLRQTMQEQVTAAMSEIEVPPEMQTKVNEILGSIVDPQSARDAITKLNEVFAETAIDTNSLSRNLEGSVTSSVTSVIERIKEHIRTLSPKDAESQIQALLPYLNEENLRQALDKARKILSAGVDQLKLDATRLDTDVFKAEGTLKVASDRYDSINTKQAMVSSAGNALQATVETQQKELMTLRAEIESLKQQLQQATGRAAGQIQQTSRDKAPGNQFGTEQLKEYNAELDRAQQKEQMLGQLKGFAQRWFSVYAVVRMVRQAIQSMVQTITELDKTITKISIVTSMSSDDLWAQMPEYTAMAQRFGAAVSGVYEVSQLYYQQGLKTNDVMVLTAETLKMAQISGLDYATATNYMTNAIRSFKMEQEDASRVTDVYAALAASSASSVEELATAMSKTASSAQAVGTSFEETSAMMAVMIEATREAPENIGSAMKSIISRYGELKNAVNESDILGEDGESFTLNKVDTALQTVGISIHDAQGQFRGFGEVIAELSSIWDTLDSNTQRYIATIMAGNRQQSRFLALVSSGERYQELLGTAENSEDAGTLQQIKTMDSIETKTQQLKTAMESLYNTSGIQKLIKGWTELKTRIVETYANLTGKGFSGIVSALAKLGLLFYNAAKVVLTTINVLRIHFENQRKLIANQTTQQIETNEVEANTLSNEQKLKNDAAYEQQRVALNQQANNQIAASNAKFTQNGNVNIKGAGGTGGKWSNWFAKGSKTAMWTSVGASMGSMILQGLADQMGEATTGERWGKGILTGVSTGLTGLSIGAMFGPIGAAIGAAVGGLAGLAQAIGIIHEDSKERAARLEKEKNETESTAAEKRASYNTTKNDVKELEKLEQHRYDSVEAMQEYLDKSNELAEQIPELVQGYDTEGNAIIDLARSYELLNDKKKEAVNASAIAMDKAYETALNAENDAQENYDKAKNDFISQQNWQIFQEANDKQKQLSQNYADIARQNLLDVDSYKARTIYGSLETDGSITAILQGLSIDRVDNNQNLIYKNLTNGSAELNNAWQLVLSGQKELTDFLSDYSTEILSLNSDNDQVLQALQLYAEKFIESTGKQSEALNRSARQRKTIEKYNIQRFTNEQFMYSKMNKDFNEELINNLPNIQSVMSDYVFSVFDGITDKDQRNKFFTSGAGQDAYNTIWKQINTYVTTDQAKQLNNLIQNRSGMTEETAKKMFESIFGTSIQKGDPLYDAVMSYYGGAERYTSETFQKLLEQRTFDKNATSFERDLADKVLQSNNLPGDQENWLTSLNDETAKAMSNYFQQLTANVERGTMSEAAAQQAMAWRIYLADEMQDYINEEGISLEEQQKRLALQSRVNALDWTDWSEMQFFLNDLTEEFGGIDKIPKFLFSSIMGLQLNSDVKSVASRINTFNNTMSETFKTMSNDLDKVTKGIDASDVFELMSKYSLSWSDFEEKQGQYFLRNPSDFIKKRYEAAQRTAADFSQQAGRIRNINGIGSVGSIYGEPLSFGMVGIRRNEEDSFIDISRSSKSIDENEIISDALTVIQEAYGEDVLTAQDAQEKFEEYKQSEISKKISFIEYIQNDLYQQALQNKKLANTLGAFTIDENGQITINSTSDYDSLQNKINNKIFSNVETSLKGLKGNTGIVPDDIESKVDDIYSVYSESFKTLGISEADFTKYAAEWLNSTEETGSFWEYLAKKYEEASAESMAALKAAAKSQMKPLLNNGQIMEFINTAEAVGLLKDDITEEEKAEIMEAILKGDLEFLKDYKELQTFFSDILNNAAKSQKDLFTQITDFTKGDMGKKYITANDYNKGLLDILKKNNLVNEMQNGMYAILNGITEESFNTSVQQALEAGAISKEDAISLMSSFHNEQYKNNIYSVLSDAVKDINGMSQETAIRVADIFGNSLREAIDTGYIVLNELTGKYEFVDEDKIRNQILKSLPQDEERNKLLAELDKNDAESKSYKAYSDLTKNYDKLSEDMVAALATQLGWSYETLRAILVDNGDGTYKMSLSQMKGFVKAKYGDQVPQAIQDQIDAAEDAIINTITQFGSGVTKGYTDTASMRKVTNAINQQFNTAYGITDLFVWNESLNTYVLTTEGMIAQMAAFYASIDSLSKEEQNLAKQMLKNNAKTLAQAIKITDLIGAQNGDPIWESTIQSIENYNKFVSLWNAKNPDDNQFEKIKISNKESLQAIIQKGGMAAVNLLNDVAKAQGQVLKRDEVEKAYRAGASQLIDVVDGQLSASIGSIVDADTRAILSQAEYSLDRLGDTDYYIIVGLGNIEQAYRIYLEELSKKMGVTASEINAAAARLAAQKYGGGDVNEWLSSAGNMTWEDFGEMLAQQGITLTEEIMDQLINSSAVKSLGGNNLAIMDWASFARTLNIDPNNPGYTSAFSSYNDAMIEMNRETEKHIMDEVGKLKDAKGGDWINLTYFMEQRNQALGKIFATGEFTSDEQVEIGALLSNTLSKFGAVLDNGILKISDNANIPGIIQAIINDAQQYGGLLASEMAELGDLLVEILQGYADLIEKGLTGTLSQSEAARLSAWALSPEVNIDLTFTETTEGLKLSNEQAILLYNRILNINRQAAAGLWDKINENLREANKHLTTYGGLQREIENHIQQMNGAEEKHLEILKAELEVLKEMQLERLTQADAFNWKGHMPNGVKNAVTFMDSVYDIQNTIQNAFKQEGVKHGLISDDDYYDMLNSFQWLADETGQTLEVYGMKFEAGMDNASEYWKQGYEHAVQLEGETGSYIDLSNLGTNIDFGDPQKNLGNTKKLLKAFADSNIAVLKDVLRILEIAEQAEKINQLDENKDTVIDLNEGFIIDVDTGKVSGKKPIEDTSKKIDQAAKESNELLEKFQNFTIGRHNVLEMAQDIAAGNDLSKYTEDELTGYATFLNNLGNKIYDPDQLDEVIKNWDDSTYEVKIPGLRLIISQGDNTVITKDGTSYNVLTNNKNLVQQLLEKNNSDIQTLLDAQEAGTLTDEQMTYYVMLTSQGIIEEKEGMFVYKYGDGKSVTFDPSKTKGADTRKFLAIRELEEMGFDNKEFKIDNVHGWSYVVAGNISMRIDSQGQYRVNGPNNEQYKGDSFDAAMKKMYDAMSTGYEFKTNNWRTDLEFLTNIGLRGKVQLTPETAREIPSTLRKQILEATDESQLDEFGKKLIKLGFNFDGNEIKTLNDLKTVIGITADEAQTQAATMQQTAAENMLSASKTIQEAVANFGKYCSELGLKGEDQKLAWKVATNPEKWFEYYTQNPSASFWNDIFGNGPGQGAPRYAKGQSAVQQWLKENGLEGLSTSFTFTQADGTPITLKLSPDTQVKIIDANGNDINEIPANIPENATITISNLDTGNITASNAEITLTAGENGTLTAKIDSGEGTGPIPVEGIINAAGQVGFISAAAWSLPEGATPPTIPTATVSIVNAEGKVSQIDLSSSDGQQTIQGVLKAGATIKLTLTDQDGKVKTINLTGEQGNEILGKLVEGQAVSLTLGNQEATATTVTINPDGTLLTDADLGNITLGAGVLTISPSAVVVDNGGNDQNPPPNAGSSNELPGLADKNNFTFGQMLADSVLTTAEASGKASTEVSQFATALFNAGNDVSAVISTLEQYPELATTFSSSIMNTVQVIEGGVGKLGAELSGVFQKISGGAHGTISLDANVIFHVKTDSDAAKVKGNANITKSFKIPNIAYAKGTLMGELGPELVVSNGHYFVVGQNGAEFVDLASDAIVFNHLQTQRLLSGSKGGRGHAVTNEKRATSYAKGNVNGGPAMAGAGSAAAVVRKMITMWEQIANMPLADLAKQGGGGGGGGGGDIGSYIADLERWYTLLQKIAQVERDINYEEKLKTKIQSDRVINGRALYESQKRSYEMLKSEAAYQRELADLQADYLKKRVEDLRGSFYGNFYDWDEESRTIVFKDSNETFADGTPKGFKALATKLYAQDEMTKQPLLNAKEQYQLLVDWGVPMEDLMYDENGKKLEMKEDQDYENVVKAFEEKMNSLKDGINDLNEEMQSHLEAELDANDKQNQHLQEIIDNQLSVEQRVMTAIENMRQRQIDDARGERDAIDESNQAFLDGLNDQLEREKQMYENNQNTNELDRMRRQLAILQRSGASASEIRSLQQDISDKEQDAYFDRQQQQIDAIEKASEAELERLDNQIKIMEETLQYEKEHGLLWKDVYDVMAMSEPAIEQFLIDNTDELQGKSTLQMAEDLRTLKSEIEYWIAASEDANNPLLTAESADWDSYYSAAQSEYPNQTKDAAKLAEAREAFATTYARTADENAAARAANAVFDENKDWAEREWQPNTNGQTTQATTKTSNMSTDEVKKRVEQARQKAANTKAQTKTVSTTTQPIVNNLKKGLQTSKVSSALNTVKNEIFSTATAAFEELVRKPISLYAHGGLADYTGLAMVHGSKNNPEAFLNADETRMWREQILSGKNGSLTSMLISFNDSVADMVNSGAYSSINHDNGINIESLSVNMNVAQISNDYDARRAAETAMDEMVKIARKTGSTQVRR